MDLEDDMNSTELLEESFHRCPDALLWCDEKGDIVKVNEGFVRMFGYDAATALKGNLGLVNPTFRSEIWRAHWNELLESGTKRVRHDLRRSDGTLFHAVMSECMIVSQGRVLNFQIIQEDSLRQTAISVQKDTELLYAMILDVGGVGIWDWNIETGEMSFSDVWRRQLGYSSSELSDGFETWRKVVFPEDFAATLGALNSHFLNGTPFEIVNRCRSKTGKTLHLLTRGKALRRADGTPYRMLGSQLDISELHKQQEIANEERERAFHSARLAALGKMAGGIAHEINNPLTILSGMAELAAAEIRKEQFDKVLLSTWIEKIMKTSERVARIVRTMRNLTRNVEKSEMGEVDLARVISDVHELSRQRLADNQIAFTIVTCEQESRCQGSETHIAQVLINLVNNAIDSLRGVEDVSQAWIRVETKWKPTGVMVRVSNGGPTIPDSIADRMMEPFFTTKTHGEGTGLGLSISHSLARQLGGELFFDKTAQSTTFVLRLPHGKGST
jgi:PAS domain S-box-containing protein